MQTTRATKDRTEEEEESQRNKALSTLVASDSPPPPESCYEGQCHSSLSPQRATLSEWLCRREERRERGLPPTLGRIAAGPFISGGGGQDGPTNLTKKGKAFQESRQNGRISPACSRRHDMRKRLGNGMCESMYVSVSHSLSNVQFTYYYAEMYQDFGKLPPVDATFFALAPPHPPSCLLFNLFSSWQPRKRTV